MEIRSMRQWITAMLGAILLVGTATARDYPTVTDTLAPRLLTVTSQLTSGLKATVTSRQLWRHWALTGLGVLAALPLDSRVQQHAVDQGLLPEVLARTGDAWGGRWAAVTILPIVYLAETLSGTSKTETLHRLEFTFMSLATVGATTHLIKWGIGRQRPNGRGYRSFPSGHTSAAFGVAEVVRSLYGNRAAAVPYALAVITGISRIHDNKHYLSDVIAGAGLGMGVVRGFSIALLPAYEPAAWNVTTYPHLITFTKVF